MIVMGLLVALMATPAFAFHHRFVPADECAPVQAGEPGNNATASAAIPLAKPLPPAGTPAAAADNPSVIGLDATCPAA